MITIRKATDRGHANHGWLDTHHTFSFADYHDPRHMGFRSLRVINDDTVAAGRGFGAHPHQDMEILSYVLDGALAHRDSTGTTGVIRPGDLQRMSAGTGVVHSEMNGSRVEPVHFLQIWIVPARRGIPPGYEQKTFDTSGGLRVVASADGRDGSVTIHADATVHAGKLAAGQQGEVGIAAGRGAWVHVARGKARVNGHEVATGDGVALTDERAVTVEAIEGAELLVFDLA